MISKKTYVTGLVFLIFVSGLNAASSEEFTGNDNVYINLKADMDGNGVGAPYVTFWRKNHTKLSMIGIVGADGASPRGVGDFIYGGTTTDSLLVGTFWGSQALQLGTSSQVRLTITSAGNVGVGTNTASAKFHVYDVIEPSIKIESAEDGLPQLQFIEAGETKWSMLNNTGDHLVFSSTVDSVSSDRLVLDPAGNVGIGTAAPSHKLSVNGAVRAKEIIVDTSWADDVFAPGYQLASLAEVEQHIQAKGHLPAVPSAAEVAENGISVGESQAMLLRKVEELTLHVIALNKQIQAQQKRLAELEAPLLRDYTR